MHYVLVFITAIVLKCGPAWPLFDRLQSIQKPTVRNSFSSALEGTPYKATFDIPANTRLEGDFILVNKIEDEPNSSWVEAKVEIYDTFTKRSFTNTITVPYRSGVVKPLTFEVVASPEPKQIIVTFITLPSQWLSPCEVTVSPSGKPIKLPRGNEYAVTQVKSQCKGATLTGPNESVRAYFDVTVKIRRHPLND